MKGGDGFADFTGCRSETMRNLVSENRMKMKDDSNMPITPKGLRFLVAGVLVMAAGFVLLAGGGSDDPAVFNPAMFDFRRLCAAPVVIICGVVMELVAIMGFRGKTKKDS